MSGAALYLTLRAHGCKVSARRDSEHLDGFRVRIDFAPDLPQEERARLGGYAKQGKMPLVRFLTEAPGSESLLPILEEGAHDEMEHARRRSRL
jgi:hypothetical protein